MFEFGNLLFVGRVMLYFGSAALLGGIAGRADLHRASMMTSIDGEPVAARVPWLGGSEIHFKNDFSRSFE